jgi:hypothetical protein
MTNIINTVNVYWVVEHKVSYTLRPLLIHCASTYEFLSSLIILPEVSLAIKSEDI